jgi:hypothetical protein
MAVERLPGTGDDGLLGMGKMARPELWVGQLSELRQRLCLFLFLSSVSYKFWSLVSVRLGTLYVHLFLQETTHVDPIHQIGRHYCIQQSGRQSNWFLVEMPGLIRAVTIQHCRGLNRERYVGCGHGLRRVVMPW